MSNVTIKVAKPSTKKPDVSEVDSASTATTARWNPILGVVLALAIFFAAQLMSGILLSYYRYPRHWTDQQLLNWLNNSISAQFFYVLIAEGLIIAGVYFFVRRYKEGLRTIGLRRPRWSDPLYGLLALPLYLAIYYVAYIVVVHLFPGLNVNEKQQLGFNNVRGAEEMVLTFISLVIVPPIAEEILFRGLVYSSLKKNLPKVAAVIGTCALFAVGHLAEGGSAGPLYIAAIDTFVLSLVLILLREKTGGLWASMTLHALKNCIAFVFLFVAYIH